MEELYKEEPKDPEIRLALVNACLYVGRTHAQAGWVDGSRGKEALAALLEAQRFLMQWVETEPNNRTFQLNLALVQNCMNFLHFATGHREQALAGFGEVVRLSRAVADADPSILLAQGLLVQSLQFRGAVLEEMDRPGDALASYEEARAIMNPSEPRWQEGRAGIANQIGNLHRRRTAGSIASRGLALARSGHAAEAVKEYRQAIQILEGLETKLALDQYHLACDHARLMQLAGAADSGLTAAEGQTERDRALGCLRAAAAAGFRDLARIQADPDLDPLRSRLDFQLLMMDMAFSDDPFAS
jgi:tetratricopeptide (TPR) repeat protein